MRIDGPQVTSSLSLNGTTITNFNVFVSTASFNGLTGSYATTGSNLFKGTQTISGSLLPAVNNAYDLGSVTHQFRDLYLSSASLYIDGTKVLGSTAQELTITTDTGQSFKILEAGADTITLQSVDGNVTLTSSGQGDIVLDPTTGIIGLKGTVTVYTGNKITASDGNSIQFGNGIAVTGSIVSTVTPLVSGSSQVLNGSGVFSGSAQLPSGLVSGSAQTIANLPSGTVSGSVQVDVMSTTNIARLATTGSNVFTSNQTITGSITISGTNGIVFPNSKISIGVSPTTSGTDVVAIGYAPSATGNNTIAIGYNPKTEIQGQFGSNSNNSIAIGYNPYAGGNNSIAIGYTAKTNFANSINIGDAIFASGSNVWATGSFSVGKSTPNTTLDVNGNTLVSGSLTITGTIIAQTINVQQVTSSIVYSCGSNIFGNDIANTQTFTGSVLVTGSLTISTGGNASAPTIFGSTIACSPIGCFATSCATSFIGGTMSGTTIYGSTAVCSTVGLFSGCVGIGITNPIANLDINATGGLGGWTGIRLKTGTSSVQSLSMGQVTAGNGAFIGMAQYNQGGYWQTEGTAASVLNFESDGTFRISTNSGLTANTNYNITERLRITSGGNVGINTTTPNSILHIEASNNTTNQFRVNSCDGLTAGVRSYTTSDGPGLIINHYYAVSGAPYLRTSDFVSNQGDSAATQMRFFTKASNANAAVALTLTSTGAATFACSVQANSIKLNTATSNGYFHIETSLPWGTKSNDLVNFTGYGYDGNIYTEHNYGYINWFSGANKGAYITAWRNLPADGDLFELAFGTNPGGVCVYERMRIKSTGIACFACTVSTPFVSTNTIELGGNATSPTTACVGYGMFGYSGVGLAIAAGASGPNQGIGFFVCGVERGRWITSGNLAIGATCPRTRLQVTPQSNAEVPVLGCASGVATFTSANSLYGLQLNSTSDGSFHIQSQRFDSATSYALVLQPAGGTVAINGNSSQAALHIGEADTRKISYIGNYSIRTTTLFKTYNQGSTTDYWARISLNNSYADSTQGVYGVITVAWHPFHASMARFYQYRFFQAPYGTNNSYMKIQTVFEEAFGWDYYQFSSDVTFYNYQSYLYIKVTGSNANYAWARSIQAELTGGSYAMDNVNLEVGVAAPAGLSGIITKNGSAVLSG